MKNWYLILGCIGIVSIQAAEILSFTMSYENTEMHGYYTPPSTQNDPIVFAINGSSAESVYDWHTRLTDLLSPMGIGLIVLEKPGVTSEYVDWETFYQDNCIDMRMENYLVCVKNADR